MRSDKTPETGCGPALDLDVLRAQARRLEAEGEFEPESWAKHSSKWNSSAYVNNHKFHGPYLHYQLNNQLKPMHQAAVNRTAVFQRSCSYSDAEANLAALPALPVEEQGCLTASSGDYFLQQERLSRTPVEPELLTANLATPKVTAAHDWNLSTSVSSQNLQQSSHDSRAKHARHSRHYNKKLVHHTGPKNDVALLLEQLRQTKKQSALQLQTWTAMYGQMGAAAMQLMPKSAIFTHNENPKAVQRDIQQVMKLEGPHISGPVQEGPDTASHAALPKARLHVVFQT